jgi:hypothetical protein
LEFKWDLLKKAIAKVQRGGVSDSLNSFTIQIYPYSTSEEQENDTEIIFDIPENKT